MSNRKISEKSQGLNKPEIIGKFFELVNNLAPANVAEAKQLVPQVLTMYEESLALIGKRALVVDMYNIDRVSNFADVQFKLNTLKTTIANLAGKNTQGSSFNIQAIDKEILAYKRKSLIIKALDLLTGSGSLDDSELEVTQGVLSKYTNAVQSIEVSILSKYAANVARDVYDKHFNFNSTVTKILSIKKAGDQ